MIKSPQLSILLIITLILSITPISATQKGSLETSHLESDGKVVYVNGQGMTQKALENYYDLLIYHNATDDIPGELDPVITCQLRDIMIGVGITLATIALTWVGVKVYRYCRAPRAIVEAAPLHEDILMVESEERMALRERIRQSDSVKLQIEAAEQLRKDKLARDAEDIAKKHAEIHSKFVKGKLELTQLYNEMEDRLTKQVTELQNRAAERIDLKIASAKSFMSDNTRLILNVQDRKLEVTQELDQLTNECNILHSKVGQLTPEVEDLTKKKVAWEKEIEISHERFKDTNKGYAQTMIQQRQKIEELSETQAMYERNIKDSASEWNALQDKVLAVSKKLEQREARLVEVEDIIKKDKVAHNDFNIKLNDKYDAYGHVESLIELKQVELEGVRAEIKIKMDNGNDWMERSQKEKTLLEQELMITKEKLAKTKGVEAELEYKKKLIKELDVKVEGNNKVLAEFDGRMKEKQNSLNVIDKEITTFMEKNKQLEARYVQLNLNLPPEDKVHVMYPASPIKSYHFHPKPKSMIIISKSLPVPPKPP